MNRIYICIDLKSFYASVECVDRNLDPLNTNLVVSDLSRTEKTVCLAITPSLKQYGLGGRARLYEVNSKIREVNYDRRKNNNYKKFTGKSYLDSELKNNKNLELDFIIAPPRMKRYMEISSNIYEIYLKYLSSDDIFVYSIDEVFCDITAYLNMYNMSAKELTTMIIKDVYKQTGITATAGIGTNMYLAKICMDITAKHSEPDEIGVRIAELDELEYRKTLWNYKPLTSFWRIGKGLAKTLEKYGMYTMGDIARMSINNEDLLYRLFGVNAEYIIDHAWGYEPTTIKEVKAYKPSTNSISSGQVLHEPYDYEKAMLIVKEMIDSLSLDLVDKRLVTKKLVLDIEYDVENLTNIYIKEKYFGEITLDHYGRSVPKNAHGTINIDHNTSSSIILTEKILELYKRIVNRDLLIRKININACNLINANKVTDEIITEQLNLFSSLEENKNKMYKLSKQKDENKLQHVLIDIKNKYGKNAILKGINYMDGATARDRNEQVGGHKG